jgi:molybdate transport system permease protein
MDRGTLDALLVTLQVALTATLVVTPFAVATGWWLARREFALKSVVETLVALPLVLPPTAIGYLLLRAFARRGWLGADTLGFDLDVLLSWRGAVIAAAVMSFPLIARTARVAFEAVPPRLEAMGASLGWSRAQVWMRTTLPLAKRGLLAAVLLGFTRAIGEFGATVIVAGNIPGRTQTLALAIFDDIQLGRDDRALASVAICVAIAFAAVFTAERALRTPRSRAA